MEDAFRLRYKVYCEEKHFLPADDYPQQLEFDEFDDEAVHLLVYGGDSVPVGYMRVVDGRGTDRFPMFSHGLTLNSDFERPPVAAAMELSRMIVRSDYRHEYRTPSDAFSTDENLPTPSARNASDFVQLKLLRLAYRHALRQDAKWFYAAMEPRLQRKMRIIGMPFEEIGPPGDYFGEVRPYAMNLRTMEATLEQRFPRTLAFFDSAAEDIDSKVFHPHEWSLPKIKLAA
jgi:N-acyl amino acid synthase of PEP-CTERM/exosortase system